MREDTIPVLAKSGDPLEQEICKYVDHLRIVLQPYSEIWFNHIFIRRIGDNSRVEDDWMNFAGSHYSAMLRVYHAYEALRKLNEHAIAEVPAADVGAFLLKVHREWAGFWENIGSVIDNFALACQDSVPPIIKENAREELMRSHNDIAYAYNRRTQFIHSRIVPATVEDNLVQFRVRTSERRHRYLEPKESRWDFPYDQDLILGDVLPQEWDMFLKAMERIWYWLLDNVRERDEGRLKVMAVSFPNLEGADIQRLVLSQPVGYAPISNIKYEPGKSIEAVSAKISEISHGPPPSGNR